MSLSNPNKVVTEERLNEYHNTILPYLGGMPDILANKFNKSDLYSTDEKMIGRWIDGKPLYQKTIAFDNLSSETVGSYKLYTLIATDENMSFAMFVNGVCYDSQDNRWYSLPNDRLYSPSDKIIPELYVDVSSKKTYLKFTVPSSSSYQISKVIVTLQYTKTTDSFVEIGLDTDYSTTEKIVGTWIDGKPIYQKTFTGNLSSMSSDTITSTIIDVASLSIEDIIDIKGVLTVDNDSNYGKTVIGTARWMSSSTLDSDYTSSVVYNSGDRHAITINVRDRRFSSQPYNLTVQYTKTTD